MAKEKKQKEEQQEDQQKKGQYRLNVPLDWEEDKDIIEGLEDWDKVKFTKKALRLMLKIYKAAENNALKAVEYGLESLINDLETKKRQNATPTTKQQQVQDSERDPEIDTGVFGSWG